MDALDGFDVVDLVASLGAGDDGEALCFCHVGGIEHFFESGAIDGDGFFHEDVFASLDCGFEHHWAEGGRGGEDDHVAIGGEDFLVGVPADKHVVGFDFEAFISELLGVFEVVD